MPRRTYIIVTPTTRESRNGVIQRPPNVQTQTQVSFTSDDFPPLIPITTR